MKGLGRSFTCLFMIMLILWGAFAFAEETNWTCESCGAINATKFCLQCGAKKPEGIVCPECGEFYPSDTEAQFCGNCGTELPKEVNNPIENKPLNAVTDGKTTFGMWIMKHYIDEFKKPTAKKYITNAALIHGIFSNSVTNNSDMTAKILIDNSGISIMLYEYGKYQVKTYSSSGDKYSISVLDSDGRKHRLRGSMYSDRISVGNSYEDELLSVFANEGQMTFSITDEKYGVNQYVFTIDDSSDFIHAYHELTGKELISWHQQALAAEKEKEEKAKEREKEREKYKDIIGQTVLLGSYEQDNNLGNGKEPIEWIVLQIENEKALLLSKYALDNRPYNKNKKTNLWSQSELRSWLTGAFYNEAFNKEEKLILVDMDVYDYKEKVTVFNTDETWRYNSDVLLCKPTQYVMESNKSNVNADGNCIWLLRNVAINQKVGVITGEGKRDYKNQNSVYAIRPVVCVDANRLSIINGVSTITTVTLGNEKESHTEMSEQDKVVRNLVDFQTIGGIFKFGKYEQDNNLKNGAEDIEWIILDYDQANKRVMLISRYGLDVQPYNKERKDVTWATCSLRKWLNKDFIDMAFNSQEKSAILLTDVDNSSDQGYNKWKGTGGDDTKDHVFLLSYAEANHYYAVTEQNNDNIEARVAPTAYALARGATTYKYLTTEEKASGCWWLRSPNNRQDFAAFITTPGSLRSNDVIKNEIMVRPVFWLSFDSDIF